MHKLLNRLLQRPLGARLDLRVPESRFVPLVSPPFALDFIQLPRRNCFELVPFFIHCGLRIRNLRNLRHGKK